MDDDSDRAGPAPYDYLSPEGCGRIRAEADRVLEQVGLEVRDHDPTLQRFREAGVRVDGTRVRFEAGQARAIAGATAPRTFIQRARNPCHDVTFGGAGTVTAPAAGPPMVRGRDGRRRYGTQADFDDFARVAQQLAAIDHAGGGYCEATDRGTAVRHLYALARAFELTDKAVMAPARGPQEVGDGLEMARVVFGADRLTRECCLLNLFNIEAPLVLTAPTAEGMRLAAEAGQASIVTSYAILGMNAPVTCAGALPLMLAEIEAGVALTQLFRPGAPVMAGFYGAPFSMSAMRPAFGAVESMMLMAAGAQLTRGLGCPVRADGLVTAAKLADAQAAADGARGWAIAEAAGVDFALHSAGWLEGGLVASLDKFMVDAAVIDATRARAGGGAGPGVEEAGVGDWRDVLASYERPPMAAATAAALEDFVAERRRAYGVDDGAG